MRELQKDDATHLAAGVAYYAVLSLFPLILGMVAIIGIFLPSETLQEDILGFFRENLPGLTDTMEENIDDVIRLRGTLGILSLIGLIWTASAMFGAIARAVNRAWDVDTDRPFLIRKTRDIGLAAGVGFLFLLSLGSSSFSEILKAIDLPALELVASGMSSALSVLINFGIFLILYRYLPNTRITWKAVWPGALLATVLFALGEKMFVIYMGSIADYSAIYGSLASVVALLVWVYLSAFILILGAEFSSEYSRMRNQVAG